MKTQANFPPLDPAFASFDQLPDSAHVRVGVVAALHDVSEVTVWRWTRSGKLPKPIKRGGTTSWQVGQLRKSMTPV